MSDPGQILRQEVQKAFPEFGSIRKLCLYSPHHNPSYDPDAGVTPDPNDPTPFTAYFIFGSASINYLMQIVGKEDVKVISVDRTALVPALDMKVEPEVGDSLVDPDGTTWVVKGVKRDPADATYKMWVRPRNYA